MCPARYQTAGDGDGVSHILAGHLPPLRPELGDLTFEQRYRPLDPMPVLIPEVTPQRPILFESHLPPCTSHVGNRVMTNVMSVAQTEVEHGCLVKERSGLCTRAA